MKFDNSRFQLIAHRGASVRAPENSLAAFRAARETGSRAIETDVQLTTDGVAVLCHDRLLTRYGHGDVCVEECSYAELAGLDFGSWFSSDFAVERIVRLDDLLAEFGTAFHYNLELKGAHSQLAPVTMALAREHGLWAHCTFTSFSWEQLQRAYAYEPQADLGWLVGKLDDAMLQQARGLPLACLCPEAQYLTQQVFDNARKVVPEVRAWGCPCNEHEARQMVLQLQEMGCSGITIDEPLWVEQSESSK